MRKAAGEVWRKPERLNPAQWAERYRYLSSEAAANPGKYSFDRTPFWREPLEVSNDLAVQEVVIMAAAQTGKTEGLNNIVGFFISHEPSPILLMQPTLELAESWSKTRLAPMIRDCDQLVSKVADSRARDSGNTLLSKVFLGGSITICGANSPTSLRSRPIRVLLLDEVDAYPDSAGTEGDPVGLATRRTDTFHNARIIKTSTPTLTGLSRIENEYESTDKRQWFVPCVHCKESFVLMWRHVKWNDDNPETAHIECPHCNQAITDKDRVDMVKAGEWRATAEFKGRAGFFINGLCSIFPPRPGYKHRLHQAVATFLAAKRGGRETLKEWVNTFLAETFDDEAGETIRADDIGQRIEIKPERLPNDILVITCGVDIQQDRIEAEVVGWNQDFQSWGLGFRMFKGSTALPQVYNEFNIWLMGWEWLREDGLMMRINATAIDSGYNTSQIYRFCQGKIGRRIFPIKGLAGWGKPIIGRGTKTKVAGVSVFPVGVDEAKLKLQALLKTKEQGPGFAHFFDGCNYDLEYFKQLAAEKLVKKIEKGRTSRKWVQPRERHDATDIRVYNMAALEYLQPNWQALIENQGKQTAEELPRGEVEQTGKLPQIENKVETQQAQITSFTPSYMNGL